MKDSLIPNFKWVAVLHASNFSVKQRFYSGNDFLGRVFLSEQDGGFRNFKQIQLLMGRRPSFLEAVRVRSQFQPFAVQNVADSQENVFASRWKQHSILWVTPRCLGASRRRFTHHVPFLVRRPRCSVRPCGCRCPLSSSLGLHLSYTDQLSL